MSKDTRMTGVEPATFGVTSQYSNQLSYILVITSKFCNRLFFSILTKIIQKGSAPNRRFLKVFGLSPLLCKVFGRSP